MRRRRGPGRQFTYTCPALPPTLRPRGAGHRPPALGRLTRPRREDRRPLGQPGGAGRGGPGRAGAGRAGAGPGGGGGLSLAAVSTLSARGGRAVGPCLGPARRCGGRGWFGAGAARRAGSAGRQELRSLGTGRGGQDTGALAWGVRLGAEASQGSGLSAGLGLLSPWPRVGPVSRQRRALRGRREPRKGCVCE